MERKEKTHLSHRRSHRQHHARNTIQSVVQLQNPFSFDNYNPLRRNHHHHRSHDSPTSQDFDPNGQDSPNLQNQQQPPQFSPEVENADRPRRQLVTPETIALERKLRLERQDHVSSALNNLSRDAHNVTRKLDDTYYSLLQKLGQLKVTLSSIQHLHTTLDQAKDDFAKESDSLANEVTSQINAFGQLSHQDENIDQLVSRLHKAKERAESYESRLESCRSRLEQWERKEQEKRQRTNRWWTLVLTLVSVFVVLLLAILMWRRGSVVSISEKSADLRDVLGISPAIKTAPGIRLTNTKIEKKHAKQDARWSTLLDEL